MQRHFFCLHFEYILQNLVNRVKSRTQTFSLVECDFWNNNFVLFQILVHWRFPLQWNSTMDSILGLVSGRRPCNCPSSSVGYGNAGRFFLKIFFWYPFDVWRMDLVVVVVIMVVKWLLAHGNHGIGHYELHNPVRYKIKF